MLTFCIHYTRSKTNSAPYKVLKSYLNKIFISLKYVLTPIQTKE